MKIAILTETFAKNMGYMGSMLPKYLARLGADVHVITMDLPPYYQIKAFDETFENFHQSAELSPGSVETFDGYTLHVLGHRNLFGYMRMVGLYGKLNSLKPDIVQSVPAIGWIALDAALCKAILGFKLFTGNHNTSTNHPLTSSKNSFLHKENLKCFFTRTVPGRFTSHFTEKCYGITQDSVNLAWKYYGVQKKKAILMHLGVDTDYFYPISNYSHLNERIEIRSKLGFKEDEIVCIYTGKLTVEKNAIILADAIERLRENGHPYRGLFIGEGPQSKYIKDFPSSIVMGFMHFSKLGGYYRSSDIGVWPSNESTSMLDAAACGLPLIVSDALVYHEHVDGNGLVYKINNKDDLIDKLTELSNLEKRKILGSIGSKKMLSDFSWASVAKRRITDYRLSLGLSETESET